MLDENDIKSETGFGIGTSAMGPDHPMLEVDVGNKKVNILNEETEAVQKTYTFEEFIKLKGKELII